MNWAYAVRMVLIVTLAVVLGLCVGRVFDGHAIYLVPAAALFAVAFPAAKLSDRRWPKSRRLRRPA